MNNFSDTHIEQLSAYIDHRLSPAERRALEAQLEQNPALRAELAELQSAVQVLRDLPPVMPPRTFTLDPAVHQRRRPVFSVMRWAGAFSAFVLILAVGLGVFSASVQNKLAAPTWVGEAGQAPAAATAAPAETAADTLLMATSAPATAAAGAAAAMPESAKDDPTQPAAGGAQPESPGEAANAAPTPPPTMAFRRTATPASAATSVPTGGGPAAAPTPSPILALATEAPSQPMPGAPVEPPVAGAPTMAPPDTMPAGAGSATGVADPQAGREPPLGYTVPLTDAIAMPRFDETESSSPGTARLTETMEYSAGDQAAGGVEADREALGGRPPAPSAGAPSLGLIFLLVALLGVSLTAIVIGWRMLRAKPKE